MLSPYGIWVDATSAAADARSLAGDPPDVVVHRGSHVTGSDALQLAQAQWPNRHFVRELRLIAAKWVAVQAP
jgi:hypothetical protein